MIKAVFICGGMDDDFFISVAILVNSGEIVCQKCLKNSAG